MIRALPAIDGVDAIATTLPDQFDVPLSLCLVRVTAGPVTGWGEICDSYCCTFPGPYVAAVEHVHRPALIGETVGHPRSLVERLRGHTRRRLGDQGFAVQVLSGLELALWDCWARAEGVAVAELLGRCRSAVPVYASSKFLDEGDADWHLELVKPHLDAGVTAVKVRASLDPAADVGRLAAVVDALPAGTEVVLDGNEHYSLATASRLARDLAGLGVAAFEEPVPQPQRSAIARLVAGSPVPIAYGEHLYGLADLAAAMTDGLLHVVQPDPAVSGGLSTCIDTVMVAEASGVAVMPHSAAGPVALSAGLTLGAVAPAVRLLEHPYTLEPMWRALGADTLGAAAIEGGALPVPDGPGWGFTLDEDALAAHPYRPLAPWRTAPVRSLGRL